MATLQTNFQTAIESGSIKKVLEDREELSISEYETMFNSQMPLTDDNFVTNDKLDSAKFYLAGQKDQQRLYQRREG